MVQNKKVPFPRVVYGPKWTWEDQDDCVTIMDEDERPDGYVDSPHDIGKKPVKAKKADDAEEKAEIRAFLDEHNVEYSPNLGLAKLKELEAALNEHINTQDDINAQDEDDYGE